MKKLNFLAVLLSDDKCNIMAQTKTGCSLQCQTMKKRLCNSGRKR